MVLTLVAKDSSGLTGTASICLEPRAAHVRVRTDTAVDMARVRIPLKLR